MYLYLSGAQSYVAILEAVADAVVVVRFGGLPGNMRGVKEHGSAPHAREEVDQRYGDQHLADTRLVNQRSLYLANLHAQEKHLCTYFMHDVFTILTTFLLTTTSVVMYRIRTRRSPTISGAFSSMRSSVPKPMKGGLKNSLGM